MQVPGASAAPTGAAAISKPAPAFSVIAAENRPRTLGEFRGKLLGLEWSSSSCPYAKAQYVNRRIQELQKWWTQHEMVWLTIFSSGRSRSEYLEPARAEAFNKARGGVPSALLIDASGDMGHAYGAQTVNHMFIVDRNSVLVHAGGIDDGETMDPKKLLRARSYVRPALEDLLAGRPVKQATTNPAGCSIAYA